MKEALRTDGNIAFCRRLGLLLRTSFGSYANLLHPVFPGEAEIFRDMYTQVGEEEQIISPPYTRIQEDVRRGRKKRKQGDDNALMG